MQFEACQSLWSVLLGAGWPKVPVNLPNALRSRPRTRIPELKGRCGKLSGLRSRAKDTSAYGEEAAECGTASELLLISGLQSCLEATSPGWRLYVHVDWHLLGDGTIRLDSLDRQFSARRASRWPEGARTGLRLTGQWLTRPQVDLAIRCQ